ncbi:hypothetical protein ASZ78_007010 [Callipepla squamata]|uniref:Uncharacterized protein n=1 Tax=Callipepla squamata TaxID=9009 RepID=A0A226NBF3_CALSU|nr:hypothetical protein ASZ78_007010 [Callipepla squamata]
MVDSNDINGTQPTPIGELIADRADDREFGRGRICPYCFQFLVPDSCRVRLKPKMKVTPRIEKILKREAKNYKLNMKQIKLLKKYRDSKSVLHAVLLEGPCRLKVNTQKIDKTSYVL